MRNRIGLIAAWTLVTLIGISVTSAAVGSVRNNVTDTVAPRFAIEDEVAAADASTTALLEAAATTTTSNAASTTVDAAATEGDLEDPVPDGSVVPSTTSASASTTAPPTSAAAPTTTTPPSTSPTTTTTTTTTPPATTTTTTVAPAVVKTYISIGGSVTVEVSGNTVTLLGAVPNAGFSAQEKSASDPDKVVVEFESENHQSTITVEVEDGVIEVDIDEEPGDD
ncbi:MAG TPA: hypothetical protein VLG28_16070 [Acidimicrobiia bacterium]|nr:hypothetical protein [Acidimicrobiia bacterium]